MSDLRQQLREHYASQSLSSAKVEKIFARGRAVACDEVKSEPTKVLRFPSLASWRLTRTLVWAAAIAIIAAITSLLWHGDSRVPYDTVPSGFVAFIAGNPTLHHPPRDKKELHAWLVARGAPADFRIPPTLLQFESVACDVVNVRGRSLYLSCYRRVQRTDHGDLQVVHLLVGRKSDFRGIPKSTHPELKEVAGWSFASWSEGEIVYTLATAAPLERLRPLLVGDPTPKLGDIHTFTARAATMARLTNDQAVAKPSGLSAWFSPNWQHDASPAE
jgi:hypothetical protein